MWIISRTQSGTETCFFSLNEAIVVVPTQARPQWFLFRNQQLIILHTISFVNYTTLSHRNRIGTIKRLVSHRNRQSSLLMIYKTQNCYRYCIYIIIFRREYVLVLKRKKKLCNTMEVFSGLIEKREKHDSDVRKCTRHCRLIT